MYDRTSTLKEYIVNKIYRRKFVETKKAKFNALDNINLEIRHGERIGIIGHNGAGKSTLLKAIAGLIKPTSGDLFVHGSIQPLIEIAAGFNPEFSGRENIYLNGYMLGFNRKQIRAKEREIIEFADLSDFIDVPVKYYSSGMAVRLAFTIATSIEPEYLIFDEMLSAGDAAFFEKARRRMDALVERAKIVVIVSHGLESIKTFANRAIVMEKGQIVFDGAPDDAVAFYMNQVRSGEIARLEQRLTLSHLDCTRDANAMRFTSTVEAKEQVQSARVEFGVVSEAGKQIYSSSHTLELQAFKAQEIEIKIYGVEALEGQHRAFMRVVCDLEPSGTQTYAREHTFEVKPADTILIEGHWGFPQPHL